MNNAAATKIQRMWRASRPRSVEGKNLRLVFAHSMITPDDKPMKKFPKGSMLIFLGQCTKKMHSAQIDHWKHILSDPVRLHNFIAKHPGAVYTDKTVRPIDVSLHFKPNPGQPIYFNVGVWNLKTRGARPLVSKTIHAQHVNKNAVLNNYKHVQGEVVKLSEIVKKENTVYIVIACRVLHGFNVGNKDIQIGNTKFPVNLPGRANMSAGVVLNRLRRIPQTNLNDTTRRILRTAIRAQERNKAATRFKRFPTRGKFLEFLRGVHMNTTKNKYATMLNEHLNTTGGFTSENKLKIRKFIHESFRPPYNPTVTRIVHALNANNGTSKVKLFDYMNKNTTQELHSIVNKLKQHIVKHGGAFQTQAQKNAVALFLLKFKSNPILFRKYAAVQPRAPNPNVPMFNVGPIQAFRKKIA